MRELLADPLQPYSARMGASLALAWYERLKIRPTVDVTSYRLGPATILHLPGEAFVEQRTCGPIKVVRAKSWKAGGTRK